MNHSGARGNYNRLSRRYDWFAGSELKLVKLGLDLLDVTPGEKVLEIGFGTGNALVLLAGLAGVKGKVFGIDISDGMLNVAKGKVAGAGFTTQVDIRLGDAIDLPFEDNIFDVVFMSFTLELFGLNEIPLVLRECKRVLRDNGRLSVVALQKNDCLSVRIYEWFHFHMPSLVDCRPINLPETISAADFISEKYLEKSLWGLPVSMVVARKNEY